MRHVLRMLDANLNRAREGLRVVEDWARFVRGDADLSAEVRDIRRTLSTLHTADMVLDRDTPNDVGTATPQRTTATTAEMVVANAKRVGEALRCVEEALKVTGSDAATAERLRHRFYEAERRATVLLARPSFADVRVYVLITERICNRPWQDVAMAALAGGAKCIQLREPDLPTRELTDRARWLADRCIDAGAHFILNDRADVASFVPSAGVHVGQSDLSVADVRTLVGDARIIGVSTHNVDHVRQAIADGADYVGVGPIYPSATKPRDFLPGLAFGREAAALPISTVAIGGITLANAADVFATGVQAVAVTAAVCAADDPQAATEQLHAAAVAGGQSQELRLSSPAATSPRREPK